MSHESFDKMFCLEHFTWTVKMKLAWCNHLENSQANQHVQTNCMDMRPNMCCVLICRCMQVNYHRTSQGSRNSQSMFRSPHWHNAQSLLWANLSLHAWYLLPRHCKSVEKPHSVKHLASITCHELWTFCIESPCETSMLQSPWSAAAVKAKQNITRQQKRQPLLTRGYSD